MPVDIAAIIPKAIASTQGRVAFLFFEFSGLVFEEEVFFFS